MVVGAGDVEAVAGALLRQPLAGPAPGPEIVDEALPIGLLELVERSERLYERVRHLDERMYLNAAAEDAAPNPVLSQHNRLLDVFGAF